MMNNKIYTYLGIVCLAVLTGCTTSSHSNENYTSSSDVVSVSLTHEQIHDGDQSKDTAYDTESSNETSSNVNDLIYYGKSSIQVDKGSNIIVRLARLDDYDSLTSVCVYNCQTKQEVQLPVSSEIKYTAEDDASYYIYAINSKGESLDLSNSISIEHAYTTDNEFIMD